MSGPFPERLSGFTPDPGRLDRDALLVAVGRASARPNRRWIALAGALAVSQTLTLGLLLVQTPTPPPVPPAAGVPVPRELPAADPPDSPGVWSVRHRLREPEGAEPPAPAPAGTILDGGPPLRAFAPPPPALLN